MTLPILASLIFGLARDFYLAVNSAPTPRGLVDPGVGLGKLRLKLATWVLGVKGTNQSGDG